jgi:Zn-dependent M28 family amino/carboxypeptidase
VFDRTPQGGYNFFHSLHDASGTVLGRVNHDMGRAASGSDHYPFFKKGVPAIFFFEGTQDGKMNPDYHGRGDTAEKVDYNKLADITRFAYKHLLAAASRRVS